MFSSAVKSIVNCNFVIKKSEKIVDYNRALIKEGKKWNNILLFPKNHHFMLWVQRARLLQRCYWWQCAGWGHSLVWNVWCQCGLCGQKPLLSLCHLRKWHQGQWVCEECASLQNLQNCVICRMFSRSLNSFLSSARSKGRSRLHRFKRCRVTRADSKRRYTLLNHLKSTGSIVYLQTPSRSECIFWGSFSFQNPFSLKYFRRTLLLTTFQVLKSPFSLCDFVVQCTLWWRKYNKEKSELHLHTGNLLLDIFGQANLPLFRHKTRT